MAGSILSMEQTEQGTFVTGRDRTASRNRHRAVPHGAAATKRGSIRITAQNTSAECGFRRSGKRTGNMEAKTGSRTGAKQGSGRKPQVDEGTEYTI